MARHPPKLSGEKTCTHCGETKHVHAFPAHPDPVDGLNSWCRTCTNEQSARSKNRKARLKGTRGRKAMRELSFKSPQGLGW